MSALPYTWHNFYNWWLQINAKAKNIKLSIFNTNIKGWLKYIETILAGLDLNQRQKHHTLISAMPMNIVLQVQDPIINHAKDKTFHNLKWYEKPNHVYFNELQRLTLRDDFPSSLWN